MQYTYPKSEKLKSKKRIERLFDEGKSVKAFPLRMVYMPVEELTNSRGQAVPLQVGVSVSKRNFKLAVSRNRIKRLMRESYRLHKHILTDNVPFIMLIIYTGREELTQAEVSKAMVKLLNRFDETL